MISLVDQSELQVKEVFSIRCYEKSSQIAACPTYRLVADVVKV